jgi:hypothetical protein
LPTGPLCRARLLLSHLFPGHGSADGMIEDPEQRRIVDQRGKLSEATELRSGSAHPVHSQGKVMRTAHCGRGARLYPWAVAPIGLAGSGLAVSAGRLGALS